MSVAIIGCKRYEDYKSFQQQVDFHTKGMEVVNIIAGGGSGVDLLSEEYAEKKHINFLQFKADFNRGRPLANLEIIRGADLIIAFPSQTSVQTRRIIAEAKRQHKKLVVTEI